MVAEKLGHKNVEITKKYYTDMKNSLMKNKDKKPKSSIDNFESPGNKILLIYVNGFYMHRIKK